jgi:hypothetical protein
VFYADLTNYIVGVIVIMLTLSVVRDGIWSGQTKDYKIGICFFSTKHAAIRAKTG